MVGHPRFRLPLARPSKRGCREGRESRECLGGDAEREFGRGACVTACNLASASSLAEITGSLFSLVPRNRPLSPSLSFSLSSAPLYPLAAQSCDFVSKTLLSRQRCRGRYTSPVEDHRGEPDFLMPAASSIRASFHGGRISRRDIGNNEFIKVGRTEIGNTVSVTIVDGGRESSLLGRRRRCGFAVNSRQGDEQLVFLSLFQNHRDIPGVVIFLASSGS